MVSSAYGFDGADGLDTLPLFGALGGAAFTKVPCADLKNKTGNATVEIE
jgi:hypothetical protein